MAFHFIISIATFFSHLECTSLTYVCAWHTNSSDNFKGTTQSVSRSELCIYHVWWLLFVRAWSLLVVRSIDCCSCPEPSCLSVERLSFIEAWVITALWPKCSCCLVFSYVLCIVWAGCFCRTTIVMTIFWSVVCWNSVLESLVNILAGYLHL